MGNSNAVGSYLVIAVAACMAVLGVIAGTAAWRRRVGRQRVCGRCEYPLDGLHATTTRCPECGNDLDAAGGVAIGRRRLDVLLLVAAVALWLPAVGLALLYAPRFPSARLAVPRPVATRPAAAFVMPAKPFAALSDEQVADAILLSTTPAADVSSLLTEAAARASAAAAARPWSPAPWLERLFSHGLALQDDERSAWSEPWATFLESALPDASPFGWQRYLRRGVNVTGRMRDTAHLDARFPIELHATLRVSRALASRIQCRPLSVTVGETMLDALAGSGSQPVAEVARAPWTVLVANPAKAAKDGPPAVQPGRRRARAAVLIATPNPVFDRIESIDQDVTFLAPRPRGGDALDPAIGAAVARSLSVADGVDASGGFVWDGRLQSVSVTCRDAPADVHAGVTVNVGGRAYCMFGYVTWKRGQSGTQTLRARFAQLLPFVGQNVTVDVRGAPWHADETFEQGDWWPGTLTATVPFTDRSTTGEPKTGTDGR